MPNILGKFRLEGVDGYNRLFLEYAANPSRGIPGQLAGVDRGGAFWSSALSRVEKASRREDPDTLNAVIGDIESLSARLGTREDVLEKLSAAARREAFFVITGQQPGLFGGPLHTAHKVLTAVALAGFLQEATSRPFVPLYWCGADDTDFAEIRGVSLLNRQSLPISASLPLEASSPGRAMGSIAMEWLRPLWSSLRRFFEEFERGEGGSRVVEDAFDRARDHGEHASAILIALCGGRLAVVDGRSAALRRHARNVFIDYIEREDEVKRAVIDNGTKLLEAGYHAQLVVGDDSGIFLLEDGVRKTVTPELRPKLVETAAKSVERCSPGVVARNLVQDGGLLPVAVILGPAEIAYRCQISPLYGLFGIPSPVAFPRLTGTFIPPALAEILGESGESAVETALREPAEFARSVFERSLPDSIRSASRIFEREVSVAVERLSRTLETSAQPKASGRLNAKLADIEKRASQLAASLSDVGKAAALERWGFLADLGLVLRPGGKAQERTLSSLVPCLFGGNDANDDLLAVARAHVDDLLDGHARHIVYSSPK
jgi:uncharacterized protein YllA (UPF0747 family)